MPLLRARSRFQKRDDPVFSDLPDLLFLLFYHYLSHCYFICDSRQIPEASYMTLEAGQMATCGSAEARIRYRYFVFMY
jgi:hypothetical protein